MRGLADVQRDLITELRANTELVGLLPDEQAIYQGYRTREPDYGVSVTLTPVYDGSTRHRGATTRTYRLQLSIDASYGWRETKDSEAGTDGLLEMNKIFDAAAETLDDASGLQEYPEGAEGGPGIIEDDDGGLRIVEDWIVSGTYLTD